MERFEGPRRVCGTRSLLCGTRVWNVLAHPVQRERRRRRDARVFHEDGERAGSREYFHDRWLHTTATRRAINQLRSDSRRAARENSYVEAQPKESDTAWDDVQHFIDDAIHGFPEDLRIPLVEQYLLGRTLSSIGEENGISRRAVSWRIQKGVDTRAF